MVTLVDVQVHPPLVELVTVGIGDSVHIRFLEFLSSSFPIKQAVLSYLGKILGL